MEIIPHYAVGDIFSQYNGEEKLNFFIQYIGPTLKLCIILLIALFVILGLLLFVCRIVRLIKHKNEEDESVFIKGLRIIFSTINVAITLMSLFMIKTMEQLSSKCSSPRQAYKEADLEILRRIIIIWVLYAVALAVLGVFSIFRKKYKLLSVVIFIIMVIALVFCFMTYNNMIVGEWSIGRIEY